MGVFFDEQAVTFDPAPFGASHTTAIRDDLIAYLNAHGYSNSALSMLAPELLVYDPIVADSDPSLNRLDNLTSYYVQGDVLHELPVSPPFYPMGFQTVISQNSVNVGSISLHSQALLSAFLQNDAFRAITFKLPELLKMVFDEALYAHKTTPDNTEFTNFLEHLLRHQIGVAAIPADGMLDRFTNDLQKVAQDGGFTLTNKDITNTLVAFAMQKYYEEPASGADHGKALFTEVGVTGGIRFDRTDVSASLFDAKGWQLYFQNYLNTLTLEEHRVVERLLPAATDWFIQAGNVSLSATADASKAFMVGGIGNDWMVGGSEADLLIGNAGDDTLLGGTNNDTLLGGAGFDTYLINAGDGYDTVLDFDGAGVVKFGAVEAKGSAGVAADKWYQLGTDTWIDAQNGITYTRSVVDGESRLLVKKGDSNVLVKGWADGNLGIALGAGNTPAEPATVLTGTALGNYLEAASGGQRVEGLDGAEMILGSAGSDHLLGGDGGDWIVGNGGADHIEGGLGNDYITGIGANSLVDGGDGNDILSAYGSDRVTIQGPNSPITADVFWADAASVLFNPLYSVYTDSNGNPTFGYGAFPVSATYSGDSSLGGGWTYQFSVSGGVFQLKYYHPTLAPNGESPATNRFHEIDSGYALAGGVYLSGEAGNDNEWRIAA